MEKYLKNWQKKVLGIYQNSVCDLSFDHVSVEIDYAGTKLVHDFHELGYEKCPSCANLAPLINLTIDQPLNLIKMCECGHESIIKRPQISKNLFRIQ